MQRNPFYRWLGYYTVNVLDFFGSGILLVVVAFGWLPWWLSFVIGTLSAIRIVQSVQTTWAIGRKRERHPLGDFSKIPRIGRFLFGSPGVDLLTCVLACCFLRKEFRALTEPKCQQTGCWKGG